MTTYEIDTSSTNITANYAEAVRLGPFNSGKMIDMHSTVDQVIWCSFSEDLDGVAQVPADALASERGQFLIPATSTQAVSALVDQVSGGSYIYLRTITGTASTGIITITVSAG